MLQALAAGVVMGIYYDLFRILRRLFRFSALSVAIQDILFWLTASVPFFFVCLKCNGGFIRIYFVFFALLGWFCYFMTAGKLIFLLFDKIICFFRRVFDTNKANSLKKIEMFYTKIR